TARVITGSPARCATSLLWRPPNRMEEPAAGKMTANLGIALRSTFSPGHARGYLARMSITDRIAVLMWARAVADADDARDSLAARRQSVRRSFCRRWFDVCWSP